MTERYELIGRYLEGKLSGEELAAFEERQRTDPAFAEDVKLLRQMTGELRAFGGRKALKEQFDKLHSEMESPVEKAAAKTVAFRDYFRTMVVAASVVLVTTIGIFTVANYWKSSGVEKAHYKELKMEVESIKRSHKKIWKEIYDDKKIVNPGNFSGTGFALSSNGYVVTSYHLVRESDSVFIENEKFGRLHTTVVYTDKVLDLAILRVMASELKSFGRIPYTFNTKTKGLGEKVFTLGYPREDIVFGDGYISSRTGYKGDTSAYQVSIPVNPGNSGGPLLDERGNVSGIVSGKQTDIEGAAFALKTFYLRKTITALEADSSKIRIQLPTYSPVAYLSRSEQIRKIQDYVFRVRVYK